MCTTQMPVNMASAVIHLPLGEHGAGTSQLIGDLMYHSTALTSLPAVTIWMHITEGNIKAESCLLSQTDSTSAEGWLRKSNYDKDSQSSNCEVKSHLATTVISSKSCLYLQWCERKKNDVSGALSHDHHLFDSLLTSLLSTASLTSSQMGWLICLLQKQTGKCMQSLK